MPELPEVETTRLGIASHLNGKRVKQFIIRERRLRWPVANGLGNKLCGQTLHGIDRRAKYLLFNFDRGCLIWHLGMSGSMRIVTEPGEPGRHEHVDLLMHDDTCLRFRDPRRFGSIHYTGKPVQQHKLLRHLGPEPLSAELTAAYLYRRARGRKQKIKTFIMDSKIVVGVGNIYASEALFESGIHPGRRADQISLERYAGLAGAIQSVLTRALAKGGTTLRDFVDSNGEPGYFSLELAVYDRGGEPCRVCGRAIRQLRLGQRSTYYCGHCQR
ncbi:MAG: bifunctional DNA-formamidopyrimidine glycosylase/DNA-(apurinic or apyrimidinic site) lyase [Gammaproteobacteria bacterium]